MQRKFLEFTISSTACKKLQYRGQQTPCFALYYLASICHSLFYKAVEQFFFEEKNDAWPGRRFPAKKAVHTWKDILVNWFTCNGRTVDNVHGIYHFDRLPDFHTEENKTLVINNDARFYILLLLGTQYKKCDVLLFWYFVVLNSHSLVCDINGSVLTAY